MLQEPVKAPPDVQVLPGAGKVLRNMSSVNRGEDQGNIYRGGPDSENLSGYRSVSRYMRSLLMRNRWVEPMVEEWVEVVSMLAKVAGKHPQSAYNIYTTSLQTE